MFKKNVGSLQRFDMGGPHVTSKLLRKYLMLLHRSLGSK